MKQILIGIGIGLIYMSSAMGMTLSSTAFSDGGKIPDVYSCRGKEVTPDLQWSAAPPGTQSFALIVEDPDAPSGIWTHWVLFNIPANTTKLLSDKPLPLGVILGNNSWGKAKYNGPCPPANQTHRYEFKLYALDTLLALKAGASAREVRSAADRHVLGQAKLKGLYGQ